MERKKDKVYPVMQWPIIAFFLTIAAGSMDGFTFHTTQSFSTVQSGNVILVGQSIASSDWHKLLKISLTIISFGIGAFVSQAFYTASRKMNHIASTNVLLAEIVILLLVTLLVGNSHIPASYAAMIISFVAGMQGNAFHKLCGMSYGNIAVTLVVQNAFSYTLNAIRGEKDALKKSAIHFFVLLGFALGGFIGTVLTRMYSEKSLWLTATILTGIVIWIKLVKKAEPDKPIDP